MNALHGDCQLLRDIEEKNLYSQAPLCCQECPELFLSDGFVCCYKSDAEISLQDEHCERLIHYRLGKLAYDLDDFSREMTKRLEDLRDAINKFLEEVA